MRNICAAHLRALSMYLNGQTSALTRPRSPQEVHNVLLPRLRYLLDAVREKEEAFGEIIKCGRTHLMDATPLSLGTTSPGSGTNRRTACNSFVLIPVKKRAGQEFSGYRAQLEAAIKRVEASLPELYELAIGVSKPGFPSARPTAALPLPILA